MAKLFDVKVKQDVTGDGKYKTLKYIVRDEAPEGVYGQIANYFKETTIDYTVTGVVESTLVALIENGEEI